MKKSTKKIIITWSVLTIVFMLFLAWNGAFDKPLSEDEIDDYIEKISQMNPDADFERLREYMEADDGKAVIMVNAIKLYDSPQPVDDVQEFETSQEALNDYTNFVLPYLLKRGSYPIFNGVSLYDSLEVWGIENADEWTSAALMRYKSRRVMMEMSTDPVFDNFHESKIAAIEKTFAFPVSSDIHLFDPTILVGAILIIIGLITQLSIGRKRD